VKNMKKRIAAFSVVVLILAGFGAFAAFSGKGAGEFVLGSNPELPTLTFYTTGLATTPQIPFWHAVKKGEILKHCNLRVRLWKNLDDLRGILLAGKGDLWLGHTDGFWQAALAGAPVKLMAVTGWRKFYLVSRDSGIKDFRDFEGRTLAFAPPGSPAVPVLESVTGKEGRSISFRAYEPRQLAMKLMKGDLDAALLPEPLVTTLTSKVDGLRVVACVEEVYGRETGGPARMPIAGIAVNSRTAERETELMKLIAREMIHHGLFLEARPEIGVDSLPPRFESFVSKKLVLESLKRDLVKVELSRNIADEIENYLHIVHPRHAQTGTYKLSMRALFW
jgi:NitT/TauT family transport system substrate-binding protein